MSQQVKAIYENGILKPLAPLDLEEEQLVSLSIEAIADHEQELAIEEYRPLVVEQGDPSITWEQVQAVLARLPGPLSEDFDRERDERS
jgi:predicted DNA-binding antitoxin AbrB/MazE fold protein